MMMLSDGGTEVEEGWETVQRSNKTKFRPSPTGGPAVKMSVPARQADGDGWRNNSQMKHKDGNSRSNVASSRHTATHVAAADSRKQPNSVSAVDVNGNCRNIPPGQSQHSKSSSHVSGNRSNRGAKSSPRSHHQPATLGISAAEAVKSETSVKTVDVGTADVTCGIDGNYGISGSGDGRFTSSSGNVVTSVPQTNEPGDIAMSTAVSSSSKSSTGFIDTTVLPTFNKPCVSIPDNAFAHSVSCRTSSSMTEVHRSESADIQRSSSDSDRQSFHLCRKSVSDDTLVERLTVSGQCSSYCRLATKCAQKQFMRETENIIICCFTLYVVL